MTGLQNLIYTVMYATVSIVPVPYSQKYLTSVEATPIFPGVKKIQRKLEHVYFINMHNFKRKTKHIFYNNIPIMIPTSHQLINMLISCNLSGRRKACSL